MTSSQSTSLRRSGARTRSVLAPVQASLIAVLLLGATLTGCADDDPDTATDPQGASSPSSTPEATPGETPTETPSETSSEQPSSEGTAQPVPATGSAGVTEATMISATEAGGSASTLAFVLDTDQARADFAAQFERGLGTSVLAQLDTQQVAAGSIPYGAVAAVGCDAPKSVRIDAGEAGLEVTAQLPTKTVQCFAPMTFVVLFAAPGA